MQRLFSLLLIACTIVFVWQTWGERIFEPSDDSAPSADRTYAESRVDIDARADECSTFCTCSCAQDPTPAYDLAAFTVPADVREMTDSDFQFYGVDESKTHRPFWQPPKA